jgi:hypothetical protein
VNKKVVFDEDQEPDTPVLSRDAGSATTTFEKKKGFASAPDVKKKKRDIFSSNAQDEEEYGENELLVREEFLADGGEEVCEIRLHGQCFFFSFF